MILRVYDIANKGFLLKASYKQFITSDDMVADRGTKNLDTMG